MTSAYTLNASWYEVVNN